jgi:hypothetical protein
MLFKAKVWSRLTAGIVDSNPAKGMDVHLLCLLCCVDSGLCDEMITRSEDSVCVCVCVCVFVI